MPELQKSFLQISPHDNLLVALQDLDAGTDINWNGTSFKITENIPAKHKFAPVELESGKQVRLYGVLVGETTQKISPGERITTQNVVRTGQRITGQVKVNSVGSPHTFRLGKSHI